LPFEGFPDADDVRNETDEPLAGRKSLLGVDRASLQIALPGLFGRESFPAKQFLFLLKLSGKSMS
jgi:hypothetical protein